MAAMPLLVVALLFGFLIGVPLFVARRQTRQDRRRIMAEGITGQATITKIGPQTRHGHSTLYFSFQPNIADPSIEVSQRTSRAAIDKLGLVVGSPVQVHYLAKWPKFAFIDALVLPERILASNASNAVPAADLSATASLFYISYAAANNMRWAGNGDVVIGDERIRFTAQRRRPFWFPKTVQSDFAINTIANVERSDATVRLAIRGESRIHKIQFQAVNVAAAESITGLLPSTRTEAFSPVLAERAAFGSALLAVTPRAPVTPALICVNVFMFLIATALGGGLFRVNPAVMIGLGTNYTPLTLGGQWWRLFTSIFLHFGLLHIALNMWALYVNGRVAERIFGSGRYLVIYLVAGLSGSVASLLWHPIVNGAGASGAIFGVLGATMAFFLKKEGGVPASVIKAQLTSVSVFVAYSLLNAARYRGIDNAAHLGGLVGGFVMGFILSRPLETDRNSKQWTRQWLTALGVVSGAALVLAHFFQTGALAPRANRDSRGTANPSAGFGPPIRSLGGFRLAMTADDVLKEKGRPIFQDKSDWVYNSIDSRHDGVVTVFFSPRHDGGLGPVASIEFTGHDQGSAPVELPYLNSLNTADVVSKYGPPMMSRTTPDGTTFQWFTNGVYIGAQRDKVYRYGIFDLAQLGR